jgi:hypothetical protein
MKIAPTTLCGLVGAVALAVSKVAGLPPWALTACEVASVGCFAALGYHAQDRSNKPPAPPIGTLSIFLVAGLLAFAGCKVGGLGVQVSSPAFGSVGVSLDGGLIGHGRLPTNAPTPLALPLR